MAKARIEVTCPGCEKPFHVPPAEQGHIAECPHCGGWVDVPELGLPPNIAEVDEGAAERTAREYERQQQENSRQIAENARQQQEGARQLAESSRQIEQAQRALDKRDEQDARFELVLNRIEEVVDQWEQLASRISQVLDRMG